MEITPVLQAPIDHIVDLEDRMLIKDVLPISERTDNLVVANFLQKPHRVIFLLKVNLDFDSMI